MKYSKPPLTFPQQVELLKDRGLSIKDESEAIEVLQNINYYRLSAYFPPVQSERDVFIDGTNLDDVMILYEFDRQLRTLLFEGLERIEITVRTQLAYHLAHKYGPWGYLEFKNFYFRFNHYDWLKKVRDNISRSHEVFIKHYYSKYASEKDLPVWIVCEAISFGQISQLFSGLWKQDKQEIARSHFDIAEILLTSWLHTIVYVRNLCAHHSRIWNRTLAIQPMGDKKDGDWDNIRKDRIFSVFLIIKNLMLVRSNWDQWRGKLLTLLGEFPEVDVGKMGFPENWRDVLFEN